MIQKNASQQGKYAKYPKYGVEKLFKYLSKLAALDMAGALSIL
jgi:hypothetical protein